MAELRLLVKSLCLLFIISALRHSLTSTLQGKEVKPSGTAKTEVSFLKAISHDTGLKGKGIGGRKMMMETMDEMEFSKASGVEHNGSNNSLERSSNQVNYQDLEANNMNSASKFGIHNKREIAHFTPTKANHVSYNSKPAKPIKTSFKISSMADENESTRQETHKGVARKIERQRLADPPEEIENLMVKDYDKDMDRHPPPINNHEPLD